MDRENEQFLELNGPSALWGNRGAEVIVENPKAVRLPRRKAIEAIAAALEEIEGHFEQEGFPVGESPEERSPLGESGSQDEPEEDYYDGGFSGARVFDREDIEVAIDVFISRLVQEGVVRKRSPSERICFSDVLERFFGEDHKIVEAARAFEEHIAGYFDIVSYDDMSAAYQELLGIRDMIKQEANRNAEK